LCIVEAVFPLDVIVHGEWLYFIEDKFAGGVERLLVACASAMPFSSTRRSKMKENGEILGFYTIRKLEIIQI
jgi:hypothetical protein